MRGEDTQITATAEAIDAVVAEARAKGLQVQRVFEQRGRIGVRDDHRIARFHISSPRYPESVSVPCICREVIGPIS